MVSLPIGECEHCRSNFEYRLAHNGFGETAYAYCDLCGCIAYLSGWFDRIPPQAGLRVHGPIPESCEPWLAPCQCGGTFRGNSVPRCPICNEKLSAEAARRWIEANAPGTQVGWRWQRSWQGMYSIEIEGRSVSDNWINKPVG